jgi:hypothetical protein
MVGADALVDAVSVVPLPEHTTVVPVIALMDGFGLTLIVIDERGEAVQPVR